MNARLGRLIADAIHEAVYGGPLCEWCQAAPDQPHDVKCPQYRPAFDDLAFCDRCGVAYATTCACDGPHCEGDE